MTFKLPEVMADNSFSKKEIKQWKFHFVFKIQVLY